MNTINQRKELFRQYILEKESPLNDEIIVTFFDVCNKDKESNHRYFFPFFKATFKFYENSISDHLDIFAKWFMFFEYKDLIHDKSEQNYSELDCYIIMSLKINQFMLDEKYIQSLMEFYSKLSSITSFDADFFIKYNLCKFLYQCKKYEEARLIYFNIIVFKREWYILMLPYKYRDYQIKNEVIPNVLYANTISHYDFNIILKYLKDIRLDTKSISYVDIDPTSQQVEELKNLVTKFIFDNKFEVHLGKLSTRTRSNAGFINNDTGSYYINPRDMQKKYKVNQSYYFLCYDSYDFKKKNKSISALIIQETS